MSRRSIHAAGTALAVALSVSFARPSQAAAEPPEELAPWVDYARRLYGSASPCPPSRACVQLDRVEIRGRADKGQITVVASGVNLSTKPDDRQRQALIRPAGTFSVTAERWKRAGPAGATAGAVELSDDAWQLVVAPGRFSVELDVRFDAAPSVPLGLPSGIGAVVDQLTGGTLGFDESSDRHGGVVYLRSGQDQREEAQEISIRASRSFQWASVVSFTYQFSIAGLREQTRITLPRLGGESIETVTPELSYTLTDAGLEVTLSPGTTSVTATGYFTSAPDRLQKPSPLPFEQWLFEADPRHPVTLSTDGVEIDPGEVTGLTPSPRSRGFFLVESQTLSITPLNVTVDKGRRGTGSANVVFTQGHADNWLGALTLESTAAPETDRILVPSPQAPHYAASGGEAVRMFADEGTLSLRVVAPDGNLAPIGVQWRDSIGTNPVLNALPLEIPGQALHLDKASVRVQMRPGFVPMAVFGADSASGHLIDGLHIYGLLIALLGLALSRGARFPRWAMAVTFILLVGLYTVSRFPTSGLVIFLAGAAGLVQLSDAALDKLREIRWAHSLLTLAWIAVILFTVIPSTFYIKDRLYSALHPWAPESGSLGSMLVGGEAQGLAVQMAPEAPMEDVAAIESEEFLDERDENIPQQQQKAGRWRGKSDYLSSLSQSESLPLTKRKVAAVEKTVRPVSLQPPSLPASVLTYRFGSLLPDSPMRARLVIAGPVLRALWMFAECFGFAAILALLLMRSRRLWLRTDSAAAPEPNAEGGAA